MSKHDEVLLEVREDFDELITDAEANAAYTDADVERFKTTLTKLDEFIAEVEKQNASRSLDWHKYVTSDANVWWPIVQLAKLLTSAVTEKQND